MASCSAHQQTYSSTLSASPQTVSIHGAIAPFGLEEDEDGWVFGVEGHEGAISNHFVGANEFSDARHESRVDGGLRNGQPLKHYGQKKVELLSDGRW